MLRALETSVYFVVWTYGVLYSMYRASQSAIDYFPYLSSDDFEHSELLSRPKDVSDYEWDVFSALILSNLPWSFCHTVVTVFLKSTQPKVLPHFFILLSLTCLIQVLGLSSTIFLIFQICLMFAVHMTKNKCVCWAVSLLFLLLLNHPLGQSIKDLLVHSDTREEMLLAVVISWNNCRCLSFCMVECEVTIDKHSKTACDKKDSLINLLSYCLYFPLLFSGPLVMYDDFQRDLSSPHVNISRRRVCLFVLNLCRYAFWFCFYNFILHYSYLSALHYQFHIVGHLKLWSFCGLTYGMGQFFMVKYVVLYGLPSTFAGFEGITAPTKPKCVARIHLYSDMWKYFDYGLYTFLKRYIYVPVIGDDKNTLRKICGGACCFAFVYIWHGTDQRILIWTVLNFLGVTVENVAFTAASSKPFRTFQRRYIPTCLIRHLRGLCISPLLLMSAISSSYFICGVDIGNMSMKKLLINGWSGPTWIVLAFMYCVCHVAEEVKRWERIGLNHGH